MSNGRSDWICCIADGHADKTGKTWCGKTAIGFTFTSLDHAAMNGRNEGRLVACSDCTKAAIEGLTMGQDDYEN